MQLHHILGSAILSSALVSSSLIGSAIAQPFEQGDKRAPAPAPVPVPSPVAEAAAAYSSPAAYSPPAAPPAAPAAPAANANPSEDDDSLVAKLVTASTAAERLNLLQPEDFSYDFKHPPTGAVTMGMGGHTVKADRKTFPALVGTGVSMTIGFLGPCGFNTPHVHPRSAEFNVIVQGALVAEFIAENGVKAVQHNATEFQAIIFPQGAVHTEFNPTCGQSIFVAGFASEDPGVQQSAQSFFGLNPEIVKAALGSDGIIDGKDLDTFKTLIPDNVAHGVAECLKTCNIRKRDFYPGMEQI